MAQGSADTAGPRLAELLRSLYKQQLEIRPDDTYLRAHARQKVAETHVAVFDFYARYLPDKGRILDWGCRHAPDACLMRGRFGGELGIDGYDFAEPGTYSVFHGYAGLHYRTPESAIRLPYEDASFDAVVASGTLEHVAMD